MYHLLRPLLFNLDAETAHGLTLRGLDLAHRSGLGSLLAKPPAELPTEALGLRFPNPVGLAAGLDKNGAHLDALGALGFGFIEIGTITPRPQAGNPLPRLFRLPAHQAIINRMGFNNEGIDALVGHVRRSHYQGVLGINIGKNKDTPNEKAVEDYLICLDKAWPLASYITVNISSPNTQGLRDLQEEATLRRFISTLRERQEQLGSQAGGRKPMLLKIAPDLSETELDAIAEVLLSCGVDGVICTNTTIDRSAIASDPLAGEAGGLSGAPVRTRSDQVLAGMASRLDGKIPMIGVGGIISGADAAKKQALGAPLVQVYSGLIYRGPVLIGECVEAMRAGARHVR
ncbi:quinone-dependent dihydroorotate dehydrogenase [Frateuria aurantia]|uniref:Dihydroorotate dehydrogenase (quinone) n=1 Tax=Frateuria aurantia (strain ATCC 33424 / DSM 6220 / KCTC 2777 / LMG 1558 / NBRC 3245 / NCIMB 13370) TaxID=767434 RepID=H8L3B1_FRAAD|nr:quinone-dependent dihydroorotate dehydrogenase [Frateuria aurantia]AFC85547.1 dihydroorotate dehydrogenase, subfamily 2 [Frateuria aurantia DSM 6220]